MCVHYGFLYLILILLYYLLKKDTLVGLKLCPVDLLLCSGVRNLILPLWTS
jgi:hypothetical protein